MIIRYASLIYTEITKGEKNNEWLYVMRPVDMLRSAVNQPAFFICPKIKLNRKGKEALVVDHVDINEKLLYYLRSNHTGAGKAIQSKSLALRLQISGRKIRDIVNALRCEGYPICSDDGGYYYAANRQEAMRSIRQLNSRIEKIAEAKDGLTGSLVYLPRFSSGSELQIWMVPVKEG